MLFLSWGQRKNEWPAALLSAYLPHAGSNNKPIMPTDRREGGAKGMKETNDN
jgi:hypothetical protein